jgi:general stress protein 26
MPVIKGSEKAQFFADVEAATKKATWCALATVEQGEPRVRMVHPTWEDDVLWIATDANSAKVEQILSNAAVDVQFQVAPPDFVHLMVRGMATVHSDEATRLHVWDVMDYELEQFWPEGPTTSSFVAVKIAPQRVELSEMFGTRNKRVYHAR